MPLSPGCKIFVGKDVDDLFNAWVEEHPDAKVTNVTCEFIREGAYDGNLVMTVMYVKENKILRPVFGPQGGQV
jgi:hypothetical protein